MLNYLFKFRLKNEVSLPHRISYRGEDIEMKDRILNVYVPRDSYKKEWDRNTKGIIEEAVGRKDSEDFEPLQK